MLWSDILTKWEKGIILKYPKNIKGKFQWNTSVLKNDSNVPFKQKFRTHEQLPEIQNKKDFQEHINNSQNKYVISFPNLNKDTMLVIPMPVSGKNYATLKDFIDNAP
jgi:hypothetical protein